MLVDALEIQAKLQANQIAGENLGDSWQEPSRGQNISQTLTSGIVTSKEIEFELMGLLSNLCPRVLLKTIVKSASLNSWVWSQNGTIKESPRKSTVIQLDCTHPGLRNKRPHIEGKLISQEQSIQVKKTIKQTKNNFFEKRPIVGDGGGGQGVESVYRITTAYYLVCPCLKIMRHERK